MTIQNQLSSFDTTNNVMHSAADEGLQLHAEQGGQCACNMRNFKKDSHHLIASNVELYTYSYC